MFVTKYVTAKNLHPGQSCYSVKDGARTVMFSAKVISVNPSFVKLLVWNKNEEDFSTDCLFEIALSDEEIKKEYRKDAEIVYKKLQNRLCLDEIGPHEFSNNWLSNDIYEMAYKLKQQNMTLDGICYDIPEKHGLIGDYDIAVVVSCSNGEKFWSHFRSETINEMIDFYKKDFDTAEISNKNNE